MRIGSYQVKVLDSWIPEIRKSIERPEVLYGLDHLRSRRYRFFYHLPTSRGGLFFKWFKRGNLDVFHYGKLRLRRSRIDREFVHSLRAHEMGAPLPAPVALIRKHVWADSYESCLVSAQISEQFRRLDSILARAGSLQDELEDLAANLGRLLARLHARGIYHLDLTPRNLLVSWGKRRDFDCYLLDWEKVRFSRPFLRRQEEEVFSRIKTKLHWPRAEHEEIMYQEYKRAREGRVDSWRSWIRRATSFVAP